jgi:adenosylhomocysteine nucleosidase
MPVTKLLRSPNTAAEAGQVIVCVALALEAKIAAREFVADSGDWDDIEATEIIRRAAVAGCRGIVSFGLAGGLLGELRAGDVVVASEVVGPGQTFPTDDFWSASLISAIPGARYAPIVGVDSATTMKPQRLELGAWSGAVAVDMESHTIGRLALANGLRFVTLRVIIDAVERRIPHSARECVSNAGDAKPGRLGWLLLTRPADTFDICRLWADWRPARRALIHCCEVLGRVCAT